MPPNTKAVTSTESQEQILKWADEPDVVRRYFRLEAALSKTCENRIAFQVLTERTNYDDIKAICSAGPNTDTDRLFACRQLTESLTNLFVELKVPKASVTVKDSLWEFQKQPRQIGQYDKMTTVHALLYKVAVNDCFSGRFELHKNCPEKAELKLMQKSISRRDPEALEHFKNAQARFRRSQNSGIGDNVDDESTSSESPSIRNSTTDQNDVDGTTRESDRVIDVDAGRQNPYDGVDLDWVDIPIASSVIGRPDDLTAPTTATQLGQLASVIGHNYLPQIKTIMKNCSSAGKAKLDLDLRFIDSSTGLILSYFDEDNELVIVGDPVDSPLSMDEDGAPDHRDDTDINPTRSSDSNIPHPKLFRFDAEKESSARDSNCVADSHLDECGSRVPEEVEVPSGALSDANHIMDVEQFSSFASDGGKASRHQRQYDVDAQIEFQALEPNGDDVAMDVCSQGEDVDWSVLRSQALEAHDDDITLDVYGQGEEIASDDLSFPGLLDDDDKMKIAELWCTSEDIGLSAAGPARLTENINDFDESAARVSQVDHLYPDPLEDVGLLEDDGLLHYPSVFRDTDILSDADYNSWPDIFSDRSYIRELADAGLLPNDHPSHGATAGAQVADASGQT